MFVLEVFVLFLNYCLLTINFFDDCYISKALFSIFLMNFRLVYKAIRSTIAPEAMQVVSGQIAAKSGSPVRRQRISNQRGEVNFIAGWSRSSQHATIRYVARYIAIHLC